MSEAVATDGCEHNLELPAEWNAISLGVILGGRACK